MQKKKIPSIQNNNKSSKENTPLGNGRKNIWQTIEINNEEFSNHVNSSENITVVNTPNAYKEKLEKENKNDILELQLKNA